MTIAEKSATEYVNPYEVCEGEFIDHYSSDTVIIGFKEIRKNLDVSKAKKIYAPNLRIIGGDLFSLFVLELDMPNLEEIDGVARFSENIDQLEHPSINLPKLKRIGSFLLAGRTKELSLPALERTGDIKAKYATKLELPSVQEIQGELTTGAKVLNFHNLKKVGAIYAPAALQVTLPKLYAAMSINTPLALPKTPKLISCTGLVTKEGDFPSAPAYKTFIENREKTIKKALGENTGLTL